MSLALMFRRTTEGGGAAAKSPAAKAAAAAAAKERGDHVTTLHKYTSYLWLASPLIRYGDPPRETFNFLGPHTKCSNFTLCNQHQE